MSGALSNVHSTVSLALSLHVQAMVRLQEQAATGSRINRSSDDPSVAYRILGLNSQKRSLANYMKNISGVIDTLSLTSTLIGDSESGMTKALAEVRNTLTTVSSGTYTTKQQRDMAGSINEWLEQIVLLVNNNDTDQYLFGGTDTDSAPYAVTRTDGEITKVTYQGSNENRQVEVASGVQQNIFQIGDDIFRSDDRTDPVFIGDTGAAAGTGTASVTGYTWLNVSEAVNETQTITITGGPPTGGTFNIAFGADNVDVAWDATAADVDAALEGLSTIDPGEVSCSGTSFTSGGITITFTGDLAQTNVAEMVVTNVNLVPAGTPAISTDQEGGMQLSIDGGTAVAIPIGDKTNVAVTSPDGKVLYVNATNITTTGDELVSIAGTHDIFNTLIAIRDIFKNGEINDPRLGSISLRAAHSNAMDALDEVNGLLRKATVIIGSRMGFMEGLKNTLDDIRFNSEEEVTNLEQADIAQVVIELSRRELLYQMSLSIAGRLLSISLLDFIQ